MTTRVRKSFINNLKSQDWMDKNTKDAAREKVCVTPAMGRRGRDTFLERLVCVTYLLNSLAYFCPLSPSPNS